MAVDGWEKLSTEPGCPLNGRRVVAEHHEFRRQVIPWDEAGRAYLARIFVVHHDFLGSPFVYEGLVLFDWHKLAHPIAYNHTDSTLAIFE